MRAVLAGLFWLLPLLANAQAALSGTVLDSLTHQPLPFASVFLATTTLGTTTNEQGTFVLERVPAGSYELVASYVGYRLARHPVVISYAPQRLVLTLALEANQLDEVVVRARRRHVNQSADYQRFVELFLGRTSFSRQCRIRNPQALVVDYDLKSTKLTASATDFVQVDNLALGYRLKYYGLHFTASFAQQFMSFYGQPVFEALVPRNEQQQRRWAANRQAAYHGSLTHFLRSVHEGRVADEGFLAQKLRVVPNPQFARADSLRQRLLRQPRRAALAPAEPDSLAKWKQVLPNMQLLYTAARPLDSLRRVEPDGRIWLRFRDYLRVTYLREAPDPLYPVPAAPAGGLAATPARQQVSRLELLVPEVELQPGGRLANPLALFTEEYWGFEKIGEFLPLNYDPSHP